MLQTQHVHTGGETRQKGKPARLPSALPGTETQFWPRIPDPQDPRSALPLHVPPASPRSICPRGTGSPRSRLPAQCCTRKGPTPQLCPFPSSLTTPPQKLPFIRITARSPVLGRATDNVCLASTFSCLLHCLLPPVLFLWVRVVVHCRFPNLISFFPSSSPN